MVSASASEPEDRKFYPGFCSHSVLAIICNASLLKVRPMLTSKLALTCFKLAASLHSCHANLSRTCTLVMSNLWQACCKLKLLSGEPDSRRRRLV
ncbi:hypothetical protein AVEN_145069-1 [Araneus ventricosus]|uniref:Uncharacterized protein n=1 Tax=Araneus ventricosus TaxID=182803 RepID=A0A4Y2UPD3_ARAVE|nr:hypothetical protein AVEN_145069-1 [Araneus ventricosus]